MITITKRPYKRSFSGNPIHYELTSDQAANDSSIYFEIKIMFRKIGAATFKQITTDPVDHYPTNGVAEINIQDFLHSQLLWQMPSFPANDLVEQVADGHTGEFYIEFREITPTNQNPLFDTSESDFVCTVVRGGIDFFVWRGNNFWVNHYNTKKPFFTWQLSGRQAFLTERMFLSYLCNENEGQTLATRCKVTFTDGTQDTVEFTFNPVKNQFYFLPAGATQWGLPQRALAAAKTIHFWELSVINITDPIAPSTVTEVFRVYSDNRVNRNDMVLHYRNSLGGVDSVQIRGVVDTNLDYTYQEQERTFRPDYYESHVITAKKLITETQELQTFKGDIGHLGKEEQDRLRDAQQQREVYTEFRGKWLPINITTKAFKQTSSGDMRFTMPIEFTLAHSGSEYYTPKTVDLGDGVFTANVCLAFMEIQSIETVFDVDFATVTINLAENDIQDAAAKFQWRLAGVTNWEILTYAQLPIVRQLPLHQYFTLETQAICGDDTPGKKTITTFNTDNYVEPPKFPVTVSEVSNSGTPGGTRTQVEEFNGVNVNDVLPANCKFYVVVYSHMVQVISTGTETLNDMLNLLTAAVNNTSPADWDEFGGAPYSGTVGFPPRASHTNGSNRITLTLNYQNQFLAGGEWA